MSSELITFSSEVRAWSSGLSPCQTGIALAMKYGCDVVVDFTKEDPVEAIMKLTGGKGVDSSIEALGSAKTFAACVSVTRRAGPSPTSATTAMATACRSRGWPGAWA